MPLTVLVEVSAWRLPKGRPHEPRAASTHLSRSSEPGKIQLDHHGSRGFGHHRWAAEDPIQPSTQLTVH